MKEPDRRASIVAGTDGSASAHATLTRAAALAASQGARLHVVSAYAFGDAAAHEHAREGLAQTERTLEPSGIDVLYHAVAGDPASALCTLADSEDARLIVVGIRGTDGMLPWKRAIFEEVERKAGRPVVVVDT